MRSEVWHVVEQASFLGAGFLFWWPVIGPWPSAALPRWSTVLYLFIATVPCDILSGFLVFCDRVVYNAYLSSPQCSRISALEDQQRAGALMWTCVTIVYLVAAAIVAVHLLSVRSPEENDLMQSEMPATMTAGAGPPSVEVV
jgi:cytochrome c oxidase assembly factor CtaG